MSCICSVERPEQFVRVKGTR